MVVTCMPKKPKNKKKKPKNKIIKIIIIIIIIKIINNKYPKKTAQTPINKKEGGKGRRRGEKEVIFLQVIHLKFTKIIQKSIAENFEKKLYNIKVVLISYQKTAKNVHSPPFFSFFCLFFFSFFCLFFFSFFCLFFFFLFFFFSFVFVSFLFLFSPSSSSSSSSSSSFIYEKRDYFRGS